jgi:CMP-N-acetylneuraminic acid synthetase
MCARGGSKGIPGKNIKPLAGKPLIEYSINHAKTLASKYDAKIALSSDDREIIAVANKYGVYTDYIRPYELATDTAGKIDVIRDLVKYEETLIVERYDFVLDLDLTSPLRTIDDLERAFQIIKDREEALTLFSVSPAGRNPYFNMVEEHENGFFDLVKKNSDGSVMTRQSAPTVYELNASFYWYRRSFFDLDVKSPITDKTLVFVMDHICFDLDHKVDFDFLEYLILNNKIDIL